MAIYETLVLIATIIFILYKLGTKNYKRWKNIGVKFIEPYPIIGNSGNFFTRKISPADNLKIAYDTFPKERFFGYFNFGSPALILKDPELIRLITIKDFDYFVNRANVISEDIDPIFGKNLLSLQDQKWRDMRNTLSPAFTGSKMRNMFQFIDKCGEQMIEYVEDQIKDQINNEVLEIDCKEFFRLFTADVIATTAFGIQTNSLKDQNNDFFQTVKKIMMMEGIAFQIKIVMMMVLPKLSEILKIRLFPEDTMNFFRNLIQGNIKLREEQNIIRPDLIHLLLQARKGTLTDENGSVTNKKDLSDDDILAQAFLFFIAGFETSATTLSFLLYELVANPDVQIRLREEILRVEAEDGGKLTYDGVINKMKYLDMVINETLRKWPPAMLTDRKVNKTYVIPKSEEGPEVVLNTDDSVWVPIYALHRDPQYFPDPEKFDPERFSDENKSLIKPFTFMPFGNGPRSCIGNRFALMQMKVCLAHLLKNLSIVATSKTQIPLRLSKANQTSMVAENGIWVGLKRNF